MKRTVPLGRIASSLPREESGPNRQNKAVIAEKEGIAPIGDTLPASGGDVRLACAGRLSLPRVAGIRAPMSSEPARPVGQAPGGGRGRERRDGGRQGALGLAAPVRVRPFPRCGYRLDDPGREARQRSTAGRVGDVGSKRPKDVRGSRARGNHPVVRPQRRDCTQGPGPSCCNVLDRLSLHRGPGGRTRPAIQQQA